MRLSANHGDVRTTIEALGIPRKTFYDKLQRHGIDRADYARYKAVSPALGEERYLLRSTLATDKRSTSGHSSLVIG